MREGNPNRLTSVYGRQVASQQRGSGEDQPDVSFDRPGRVELHEQGAAAGGEAPDPRCADRCRGCRSEPWAGRGGVRHRLTYGGVVRGGLRRRRLWRRNRWDGCERGLDPLPAPVDRAASAAADEQRLERVRLDGAQLRHDALAVRVCSTVVGVRGAGKELVQRDLCTMAPQIY